MSTPVYRSFGAKVIATQGTSIVVEVIRVDNDYIPQAIITHGQTLVMEDVKWTDVLDRGSNHPIFNFYSQIAGTQRADPNDGIEILIELVDSTVSEDRFIFKHWTMSHEYAECMAKIQARKMAAFVAGKVTKKKQVIEVQHENKNKYLFTLLNNHACYGLVTEIRDELYKSNISQVGGWPKGKWQMSSRPGFKNCSIPSHPGKNGMLEERIARLTLTSV